MGCNCNTNTLDANVLLQIEDLTDYQFIQRVVLELTLSCALPLPIPASSIPPLILQAALFFWLNDDLSVEERYWVVPYSEIERCGLNKSIRLPELIVSVWGVYKANNNFQYGAMGDFSLERMIVNNSMMTAGVGNSSRQVYGDGTGFKLDDIVAALYEVHTYKSMFEYPITYSFNEFSHVLFLAGALRHSDLILSCFQRVKIQDLYLNYYFFRYVICLAKRALTQIMGTFEFKMPGGVGVNYAQFRDSAETELSEIREWINLNHACDYFFNTNTI